MKTILSLILLISSFMTALSQSVVTTVEYQKTSRDAIVSEIPFPEKTVANAIQDTLQKLGYKGKESKGFVVYKGVQMAVLGNETLDLYFSVDRKSRKEKEYSNVTMMLSRGGDNFLTAAADPGIIRSARTFLESLVTTVVYFDIEQQVAAQEDMVRAAEKKARNLAEDGEDLQKKLNKVNKQIEENAKDQADQKSEIEKQRQALETIKGKRRQ